MSEQGTGLVMYADDIATEFRLSLTTARKWIAAGRCGPSFKLGRNRVVTRAAFLEALRKRERAASRRRRR